MHLQFVEIYPNKETLFQVRMCVLNVIHAFLDKKGENYLSVLPDAVPFLYECMEDEDAALESACKKLIRTMEEVFGQSVDSYFSDGW